MPHSLISLHMAYPPGAFDGYDLLFAAGPHHAAEFAAIRKVRGGHGSAQPVGYGKLDLLTQGLQSHPHRDGPRHVLVAPSWGPTNLLNVLGQDLVTSLLGRGYRLTLRPHPSFLDGEPELVATLCAAGAASPLFEFENPSTENRAIYDADVLVSDYSGAALEFAALRRRPTVFVDVAKKVFNPDWESLGLPVAEVEHRSALGVIVQADLKMIAEGIDRVGRDADEFVRSITHAEQIFCFRPEHCGRKAASLIGELA
jgi:YidC/Oxa1 family membrane protein insertase